MARFDSTKVPIGNDTRGQRDLGGTRGIEERPAHEVEIDAFDLDVTEVTVSAYTICVDAGACDVPPDDKRCNWGIIEYAEHPMNCVTQGEAGTYCGWLGKRLPTEFEWEYAGGGGSGGDKKKKRLFPWGDTWTDERHANVCGKECVEGAAIPYAPMNEATRSAVLAALRKGVATPGVKMIPFDFADGHKRTAPVGSFPKGNTKEGLKDMAGNVWEWTSSHVCIYPDHDCDSGAQRIIRGGGWTHRYVLSVEVTTRSKFMKDGRSEGIGFRCAKDAD